MALKSKILLLLFAILLGQHLYAQQDKPTWIAYPLGFYLPETRFGLGAAGTVNFRMNRLDSISPPSQVQLGFAFTQNKQWGISLPFDLYWNERKHNLQGELTYSDYSYYYFGFGVGNDAGRRELYQVKFPRLRINYLHKIRPHIFAGGRWWYEDYQTFDLADTAWIKTAPGGTGNIASGPGLVFLYDTRDFIYSSRSGQYLELVFHHQDQLWGGDRSFSRYRADYRRFFSFRKNNTIALNVFADFTFGNVPFQYLPAAGSVRRMRGFYEGRFRDKHIAMIQAEYRKLVWRKCGAVAFINYAFLAPQLDAFNTRQDVAAAGLGLRYLYDPSKRVQLRLDFAWPIGFHQYIDQNWKRPLIYATIGEAF